MARRVLNETANREMSVHRRHLMPRLFHDSRRRIVGLIGGSFNPAHDGHVHMSSLARRMLGLDEIWWLVTPQNPLKSSSHMVALHDRLETARMIATPHKFIKVIAPEQNLRDNHTHKSLFFLNKVAPKMNFIWIMGADNLVQFPKWERHRDIAQRIPIAVIDRPGYSYAACSIGRYFLSRRLSAKRLARLRVGRLAKPPVWCFIAGRRHHASATALREQGSVF